MIHVNGTQIFTNFDFREVCPGQIWALNTYGEIEPVPWHCMAQSSLAPLHMTNQYWRCDMNGVPEIGKKGEGHAAKWFLVEIAYLVSTY